MSDESTEISSIGTEGGVSGDHESLQSLTVLVAPSTSDGYNTVRARIVPVACWSVDDIRFEFGSSFVKPDAKDEMQELDSLMKEHCGAPLSIFGHADPVGQDDLNKKLSGRRAQAIYGMLIRDTGLWEDLYKRPLAEDNWGFRSIQLMLENVGHSPGSIDGFQGSQSTAAIKAFQEEKGLAVDGNAGPNTRKELFKAYMDMICVDREGKPYQLDSEKDFLAQGADKNGKGDYQGCSEFNPRLLFSQEEEAEYKNWANREKRNTENAPNRRVIIYLFRPGSKVTPEKWPCPSVKGGTADCKKRFWSDGEKRRNTRLPEERREFEKTKDTFACRFYHRMADRSPCEGLLIYPVMIEIRLLDSEDRPLSGLDWQADHTGGTYKGRTGSDGLVRIGLPLNANNMKLIFASHEYTLMVIQPELFPPAELVAGAQERLNNLAYNPGPTTGIMDNKTEESLRLYQDAHDGLDVTGELDENSAASLKEVYGH